MLGEIGCRAANLAENTGNTANCLFQRVHLGRTPSPLLLGAPLHQWSAGAAEAPLRAATPPEGGAGTLL